MNIKFYRNTADPRVVDKTSYLSLIMDANGYMREECSVLNPVIALETTNNVQMVEANGEDVMANGDYIAYDYQIVDSLPKFNYAYIEEFNRYYYVTGITAVRSGLWRVFLKCDVLMSFKSDFVKYGVFGFVTRNEYDFNEKIDDPLMTWTDETRIYISEIPDSGASNFKFESGNSLFNQKHYVVSAFITAGKRYDLLQNDDFGEEPWAEDLGNMSSQGLPDMDSTQAMMTSQVVPYVFNAKMINSLQERISFDDTKIGAVLGAVSFPFKIPSSWIGDRYYLVLGDSYIYGNTLDTHKENTLKYSGTFPYLILADFECPSVSTYEDLPAHAKYDLYVPYYGWVDLDIVAYGGHRIYLYYSLSIIDGTGEVVLYDSHDEVTIFSAPVQVGTRLNFNTTNFLENTTQRNAVALQAVLGVVGGTLAIASGHVATGALAIAGSLANTAIKSSQIFDRSSTQSSNPACGNMNPQKAYIRRRSRVRAVDNYSMDQYAKLKGRPLMASRSLATLTGFTQVDEIVFNTEATKSEIDEIRDLLRIGVIL